MQRIQKQLQAARRKRDRVGNNASLTKDDKRIVEQLLAGTSDIDNILRILNIRDILNVFRARKGVEDLKGALRANKQEVRHQLFGQTQSATAVQGAWKDKRAGIQYSRETAKRNIRDTIPDKAEADMVIDQYLKPVHQNEAKLIRRANEICKEASALGLDTKKRYTMELPAEDGTAEVKIAKTELVQLLGENIVNRVQVEATGADGGKISYPVEVFHKIYNQFFRSE